MRLTLGATFGMKMKLGVPYPIENTVVEFEENRLIAWRHMGGHRWRYELEPVDDGTKVTETFDWSTSKAPFALEIFRCARRCSWMEGYLKLEGGLLGGKGQTKESMIKDLAKGRLVLKGIKFIASSDALEDPIDDDIALLAEALAAMEGQYVLNMPAEAKDKEDPDTTIARRRLI